MKIIKGFLILVSVIFMLIVTVLAGLQVGEWIIPRNTKQLQKELQEYKDVEETEELRISKLEKDLGNTAEIISISLNKVGEFTVIKGEHSYSNCKIDKNFFSDKKLYIDFIYNYGISYDLSSIDFEIEETDTIYKTILRVYIPKDQLQIQYLLLNDEKSNINSKKSLLAIQYTPEEDHEIRRIIKSQVRKTVLEDKKIFSQAHESLKDKILYLVDKLNVDINTIQFDW